MKVNNTLHKWIPVAAFGLLLAGSPSLFGAASDVTIPTGASQTSWLHAWGGAYQSMAYDATANALEVQAAWSGGNADNYIVGTVDGCNGWIGCGPGMDGTLYDSIELDILWDTNNTVNAGLQIGFDHGYSGTYLTNWSSPPIDGAWHHLSIPLPNAATGLANFMGVALYRWQPDGTTGTMNYWVKNVVVKAKVVPIPPPTLVAPQKAKASGLWLGATAGGGGNRNSVYTTAGEGGNGVSWVGVATPATPVTYSMTIAQYPDSSKYPAIQSHIFLSSDAASGTGAPEWNSTNVVFFRIMNNADGSAYANFMFKTNAAGSWGGQIFGTGNLLSINSTTVTGTWSVTFTSDTAVTVTTPDNTTTNFTFPADAVPYFQHVYASFGIQQNNDTYGGQYVIFSHAGVSLPSGAIDDSFTDPLPDASFSLAGPQYGAEMVPPGSVWYAKWLLPANGFSLITSPDLIHWNDAGTTNTWNFDTYGWFPLTQANLPGATRNYFRMVKRVATQLQVLLPGETNAPNTLTGKIGTPLAQTAYNTFDLTINACDATWHIAASCSDTLALTSTDPAVWLNPTATLVKGTVTIPGNTYFGSSGTWTITATDTNAVSAGTSTPITIP